MLSLVARLQHQSVVSGVLEKLRWTCSLPHLSLWMRRLWLRLRRRDNQGGRSLATQSSQWNTSCIIRTGSLFTTGKDGRDLEITNLSFSLLHSYDLHWFLAHLPAASCLIYKRHRWGPQRTNCLYLMLIVIFAFILSLHTLLNIFV